ncbi:Thioredoxin-like fold protein [Akanthomyces lecanii RCEF 1005]|uniref:Thioredoxin-like fold protein n=1 Tax=Akanthomyces lecanii RCEF 1005 TaxID=1081108 RepID=A0A162LE27_CORDF|nr:Thioredoxin-like fold protein [Akanthomyces lecanii RCEF 1005]
MARATLAFGQTAAVAATAKPLSVGLKLVNLHQEENISEAYLTEINAKGQLPALAGGALSSPLIDSLDISFFFCHQYPSLLPEKQTSIIRPLLQ